MEIEEESKDAERRGGEEKREEKRKGNEGKWK